MGRQPTQQNNDRPTKEHLIAVGKRMILETEAFLNERLSRRNGDWATDVARLNPRDDNYDRRQRPPRAEQSIDLRMRPQWGTHIEVRPNQSGIVDDPRLDALEVQLRELTDDRTAGEIIIGVKQVSVMTAGFMSLLAMIRPRLACQNRKLSLRGLRPECAGVLCGSGLEDLLATDNDHAAVVPGTRDWFSAGAHPLRSERAA